MTERCEYFAACDRDAVGTVEHPVIGAVPSCQRCADRMGASLTLYEDSESVALADYLAQCQDAARERKRTLYAYETADGPRSSIHAEQVPTGALWWIVTAERIAPMSPLED